MGSLGGHTATDPETGAGLITSKERKAVKVKLHTFNSLSMRILSLIMIARDGVIHRIDSDTGRDKIECAFTIS